MSKEPDWPHLDLPWGGPRRVKSAVLHVVAVAEYVMTYTRGWAVDSPIRRLRLKAENARLRQEVALLTEEIRAAIPEPQGRYGPRITLRLAAQRSLDQHREGQNRRCL